MSVKLTNFVKIKINHHMMENIGGTRDTAVLFHYSSGLVGDAKRILLNKMPDFGTQAEPTEYRYLIGIENYLTSFFSNGGKNIYVITSNTITNKFVSDELEKVPMEYMVVGFANDTATGSTSLAESVFRSAAEAWNISKENEKIYQKIFVSEIPYYNIATDLEAYETTEGAVKIELYVLKYGSQGIGASVLAYFTRLDVFSTNATQDYAFTTENYNEASSAGYVFNDNDIIERIIALNFNADTKLAGQIKNIGGNDTAGFDLTNQFMLLVLHQTLTEAVLNVLVSKIRYNDSGLCLVMNAIIGQLNQFVSNGYITTNKVWTDPDLYYEGYKIVGTNTPINNGYKVAILPFESLSPAERAAHQLPKIFVLLADSYSIRKIVIDGEVF